VPWLSGPVPCQFPKSKGPWESVRRLLIFGMDSDKRPQKKWLGITKPIHEFGLSRAMPSCLSLMGLVIYQVPLTVRPKQKTPSSFPSVAFSWLSGSSTIGKDFLFFKTRVFHLVLALSECKQSDLSVELFHALMGCLDTPRRTPQLPSREDLLL